MRRTRVRGVRFGGVSRTPGPLVGAPACPPDASWRGTESDGLVAHELNSRINCRAMPSPARWEGEDDRGQELQAIHADLASLVQRRLRTRMLEVRCGGRSRVSAARAVCPEPDLAAGANPAPGWRRTTTRRCTASRTRRRPTHASWSVRSPCESVAGWAPVPVQHARERGPV